MSEEDNGWEGQDDDSAAISDYFGIQGQTASPTTVPTPPPTPVGPLVSPLTLGGPLVSPLALGAASPLHTTRRGPGGSTSTAGGLGAMSPRGVCEITTLAKLAYLFFNNVAIGDTQKALAVLGIYRYLYNDSYPTLSSGGFDSRAPASIPDASWSAQMQVGMGLGLIAALGASNTALVQALTNMPGNMAALATWFPSFRNALAPGDVASISELVNSPIPTGQDYATTIASYARDMLSSCITPATSPSPTVPVLNPTQIHTLLPSGVIQLPQGASPPPTPPTGSAITQPSASGPGDSGAQPASASGSSNVFVIALVALAGYGGYLAWKDAQAKKAGAPRLAAFPPSNNLLRADLGPLAAEFDKLNERAQKTGEADAKKAAPDVECIPGLKTRRSFSMDEWGGPGADKLNRAIFALSEKIPLRERQKAEHELEDTYFQAYVEGLHTLLPGRESCE